MSLAKSTARDVMVWMASSTDHLTGKTGLTLTITASKAGAAFASITPTVTERGDGWYSLAITTSHTDTIGDLAIHVTGAGADPTDRLFEVGDPGPFSAVVEGSMSFVEAVRLFLSVLTGKSSGGGTATVVFRDIGDSKNRISATVDADGNRTAVGTRDGA
jgi:hypothetical protein